MEKSTPLTDKMRRNIMNIMEELSVVNIMLLGLTGSGKSASGNTIIGVRETFKEDLSPEAVTRICQSAQTELDGQTIRVIDTVGLSDTSVKITDAQTQIEKMLALHSVDVFLLVIRLGETLTVEYRKAVQWIKNNFGATFSNHGIVLFTHGDQLHEPIEDYGFHVFNNKNEDRSQVTELLKTIESLRIKNAYKRYTEQDYKQTQKALLLKKCATVGGLALATAVGAVGGYVAGEALTVVAAAAAGLVAGITGTEYPAVKAAVIGAAGVRVAIALAGVVASMMGTAYTAVIGAAGGAAATAVGGYVVGEVTGVAAGVSMMETACNVVQAAVTGAAGGGLTASMMGTEFTAGQVIGAAIGVATTGVAAAVAVLVGSGVYFLARKYSS